MGTMNGTRKIINKLEQGRNDNVKTKDRVEGFRKNIQDLSKDIKA
jgi:hypothetical protein